MSWLYQLLIFLVLLTVVEKALRYWYLTPSKQMPTPLDVMSRALGLVKPPVYLDAMIRAFDAMSRALGLAKPPVYYTDDLVNLNEGYFLPE